MLGVLGVLGDQIPDNGTQPRTKVRISEMITQSGYLQGVIALFRRFSD